MKDDHRRSNPRMIGTQNWGENRWFHKVVRGNEGSAVGNLAYDLRDVP